MNSLVQNIGFADDETLIALKAQVNAESKKFEDMAEGVIEVAKGTGGIVGDGLEVSGDAVSAFGVYTAQPEVVVVGEAISMTGVGINAAIDYSDGVPVSTIVTKSIVKQAFGSISSQGIKATRKVTGDEFVKAGKNITSESIIHTMVKIKEIILSPLIIPEIEKIIITPIKGTIDQ